MHPSPVASIPAGLLAPAILFICSAVACFEPPSLDPQLPPPPDLPIAETWGPLDPALNPGQDPPDPGPGLDGDDGTIEDPPDPALGQLRLLEVLADPPGKDGGPDTPEFVELYNPGPSPVPLAGLWIEAPSWPRVDAADLGLESAVLGVGGILVVRRWASDQDPSLAQVEIVGTTILAGFLHGSGLKNMSGSVFVGSADGVVYGEDPGESVAGWVGAAAVAAESGESLCRSPINVDSNSAADWSTCTPGPGQLAPDLLDDQPGPMTDLGAGEDSDTGAPAPEPIPPGAVQIVEVLSDAPGPSSDEKFWEFIEIINLSENEVELGSARIGDAESVDAPGIDPLLYLAGDGGCNSLTCLAPGHRALIVGMGYLGESADALVLSTDDSTIADGGLTMFEPAVLWDGQGNQVSSYRLWPDPQGDPKPTDEQPLHRIAVDTADEPSSWIVAPATPGF